MATVNRDQMSQAHVKPRFAQRVLRGTTVTLAVVGLLLTSYIVGGAVVDINTTDQTSGGYSAPYTDFTGTPISGEDVALEGDTIVIRGRVLDSEISCRTGMWTFDVVGIDIPYRPVSPRALTIHRPQAFCQAAGFDTSAWDQGL